MPKNTACQLMMNYVQDYLDGIKCRLDFDLDFSHTLMKYYAKMEREDIDFAEAFNFFLAEEGFDHTHGLSDTAHKKLIKRQMKEFISVWHDGFY